MKLKRNKLLGLLLVLVMVAGLLPMTACGGTNTATTMVDGGEATRTMPEASATEEPVPEKTVPDKAAPAGKASARPAAPARPKSTAPSKASKAAPKPVPARPRPAKESAPKAYASSGSSGSSYIASTFYWYDEDGDIWF
jgi:hypothetical protein